MVSPRFLHYDLGPRVTAFSTTRHGGCSQGNYAAMNVNAFCGDRPEAVVRNRELLSSVLGLDGPERLFIPHQVHGKVIVNIDHDFLSMPRPVQTDLLEGVDALMTRQTDICIGVSTADCIPIIIYDPDAHSAAVVHAGWRGTVKGIAGIAVSAMTTCCHSESRHMRAVIGPGISLKNFEVGQEVYDAFYKEGFCMEQIACRLPGSNSLSSAEQLKWHIDLPLCNRLQLQAMGLLPEHIYDCGLCTYDHPNEFFSARRLGIGSGRVFTGIVLR